MFERGCVQIAYRALSGPMKHRNWLTQKLLERQLVGQRLATDATGVKSGHTHLSVYRFALGLISKKGIINTALPGILRVYCM